MAKTDINLGALKEKAQKIGHRLFGSLSFIFIVSLLAMYGFLVFRISVLTSKEPSDDAVSEQLKTVQRPKIDQSAITALQQLQDNSVEVKTLFQAARDNPFQE